VYEAFREEKMSFEHMVFIMPGDSSCWRRGAMYSELKMN
jgi:hypothetical protein